MRVSARSQSPAREEPGKRERSCPVAVRLPSAEAQLAAGHKTKMLPDCGTLNSVTVVLRFRSLVELYKSYIGPLNCPISQIRHFLHR